jgi:glycosyltransferase involved in cell wall biosynthesis
MSELLSILIPIHEKHHKKFQLLHDELNSQIGYGKHDIVEVYPYLNNGEKSIGHYRNELLSWAKGEYLCFIDSDDRIAKDYIKTILKALESKPDCLSLRGEITIDGGSPELFEHSIKYTEWKTTTNPIKYERSVNHLNVVKSEIAKGIKYEEISFGEDHRWSTKLLNSGLLKKEVYIDKVLYYYDYISNK